VLAGAANPRIGVVTLATKIGRLVEGMRHNGRMVKPTLNDRADVPRPAVPLLTPTQKAARTARWARIMVKWLITRVRATRGWEIVNFTGRQGAESRGIVDLLAIRKNHNASAFPRGDLFEMILIQVKGGAARWPTLSDMNRLRAVADRYQARDVVLAAHRGGSQPVFYRLNPNRTLTDGRSAWDPADAAELFR
jgi:hypothetical protein